MHAHEVRDLLGLANGVLSRLKTNPDTQYLIRVNKLQNLSSSTHEAF
jgi:hypothetical protein